MPLDLLTACTIDNDVARCREEILRFYRENWQDIRLGFSERFSNYPVDEEAKATVREALDAHESGLYRCVCRTLFPELERISRNVFFNGRLGSITGRKLIKQLVRDSVLPFSNLPAGLHSLIGWERLTGHLYRNVHHESDRKSILHDPVPNRHAAIHGLVIYSTEQTSLNSIFMFEYVVQLISLRMARCEMAEGEPDNSKSS